MRKIFGFLLQYNEKKWKYYLAALVICSLGVAIVTVWEPEILRQGVEVIEQKNYQQLLKVGITAGIFILLLILFKVLLSLLQVKTQNDCYMSLDKSLIQKVVNIQKREIKVFGLLPRSTGRGKTTAVRNWASGLTTFLYKVVYSSLSTLTVNDFYRNLAAELGAQPAFRKTDSFKIIQNEINRLVLEKRQTPVIIIDEANYIGNAVLFDAYERITY